VLREGRYRFSFFSNERQEPAHIHVKSGSDQAKFWLDAIQSAPDNGFSVYELKEVEHIIGPHQAESLEAWHEYFA